MKIAEITHYLTTCDDLSEESLAELESIIANLKAKQQLANKSRPEADMSSVFGLLKANKSVSLEQMQEGIAKGACGD